MKEGNPSLTILGSLDRIIAALHARRDREWMERDLWSLAHDVRVERSAAAALARERYSDEAVEHVERWADEINAAGTLAIAIVMALCGPAPG